MTDYHVMYSDEDREWKVKKEGNLKATTTAPTKKDAEKKAKKYRCNNKHCHRKTVYGSVGGR